MTAGRHRLDGQRRDALSAWLRSLARLIPPIPISRRHRAAGGATATTPPAEAPEVPALPDAPIPGAGTSLQPPDAAPEGVTAPPDLLTGGAATRPPWVWYADEHGPWPARHDQPRGQHPYNAPAYRIQAFPLPGRLAVIDGTGAFAAISHPAPASLRDTGHLEALAVPVAREWATDKDTLAQLLDGLRAMDVSA